MKKFKFISFLFLMIMTLGILCSCDKEHVHEWTEISKTTATCTEDGVITYLCNKCDESNVVVVKQATGHKESPAVVENNILPTCTTPGSYDSVVYCSECKTELSRNTIVVPALGHTEVIDEAVEPTCITTGLTEGKHCSICNDVLVEQERINSHIYINGSCEMCGATEGLQYTLVDGGYSVFVGTATDKANIIIPSTYNGLPVTNIGGDAFEKCSFLESITIPSGITSIGTFAFYGCSFLESVTIGNSVTSIGSGAFLYCSSLENVYYSGTIEDWCHISFDANSNLMVYAEHLYMLDSNNEYYEVTEIEIPNTITTIGDYQFNGFDNLTSITISNSVTSIGYYAFYGCNHLKSVTIGNSVTSIGSGAFLYCSSLESITIPNSVTSIGREAFYNCRKLKNVYYTGTEKQWKVIDKGDRNDPLFSATITYNYIPEE